MRTHRHTPLPLPLDTLFIHFEWKNTEDRTNTSPKVLDFHLPFYTLVVWGLWSPEFGIPLAYSLIRLPPGMRGLLCFSTVEV